MLQQVHNRPLSLRPWHRSRPPAESGHPCLQTTMNGNPLVGSMSFADFGRGQPKLQHQSNKSSLQKGAAAKSMRQLPDDFQPGSCDVICGRGRNVFNHAGNERFRNIVAGYLDRYNQASAKLEKSYILSEIVTRVRESSPNGGFVKKDPKTGKWMEVGDFLAREKTSQAFRDALHDKYRSSNTAKKMRRQAEQSDKTEEELDFLERNSQTFGGDFDSIAASLLGTGEAVPKPPPRFGDSTSLSSKLQNARSARSVLDFHSYKPSAPKPAKNYNWSCPNLGAAATTKPSFAEEDDLGGSMSNFDWNEPVTEAKKPSTSTLMDRLNGFSSTSNSASVISSGSSSNAQAGGSMEFASVMPLASGGSSALASFLSKNIGQQPIQENREEDMLDDMIGDDNADALALQSLDTMGANDLPDSSRAELSKLLEADIIDAPVTPQTPASTNGMLSNSAAFAGATGDTVKDSELFAKLVMLTEEDMGDDDAFEPTPMVERAA